MEIDIPQAEQQKLNLLAQAAGFDNVERYVTEHVLALVRHSSDEELELLSPDDLKASLAVCDQSMTELEAGKGLSLEEARKQTIAQLTRQQR